MMANSSATGGHASLSMHWSDKLRFLNFPDEIFLGVRTLIQNSWAGGIQSEKANGPAYEYKLKGRPFGSHGTQEAIAARVLMRNILSYLYDRQWLLVMPYTLTGRNRAKDILVFKKQDEPLVPVDWLVVTVSGANTLRVIGDEPDVIRAVGSKISDMKTLQAIEVKHGSFEFQLESNLWRAVDERAIRAHQVMIAVLDTLDANGWRAYSAFRQRTQNGDYHKADTWYFVKPQSTGRDNPFEPFDLSSVKLGQ